MTGDELTPERLDAILDGREAPTDDDARDMLALAAVLRDGAQGASDELRTRVRTLGQPQAPGRLHRLLGTGRRGRVLIAAPALGAVLAAVIAIGVVARDPGGRDDVAGESVTVQRTAPSPAADATASAPAPSGAQESLGAQAAAGAAPVTVLVPPTTLSTREAELRRVVADAGGTVTPTSGATKLSSPSEVVLSVTVPDAERDAVFAAIAALGSDATREAFAGALATPPTPTGTTTVQVRLTETP